jgi:hypothetical protein
LDGGRNPAVHVYTVKEDEPSQTVTGQVCSYNPQIETSIKLFTAGTDNLVASTTIEALSTGFGRTTQGFTLKNVPEGIYTLVVSKGTHLDYTITRVAVGNGGLNLTLDPDDSINTISLRCGDINGDGLINDGDLTVLWMISNYNRSINDAADSRCDLNGDGLINDKDLTILWMVENYNKGEVMIE